MLAWWEAREETEQAWLVSAATLADREFNLDVKNPRAKEAYEDIAPEELAARIGETSARLVSVLQEIDNLLGSSTK